MKRIIDFDAIWSADRIERLNPEHRYEYLWMYGVADATGSFEIQSPSKMCSRVGGGKQNVRPDLTPEKMAAMLDDFMGCGLLFTWKMGDKTFGHWVGSTKPGRLPTRAARDKSHYKVETPGVPLEALRAYCKKHGVHLTHWPECGEGEPERATEMITGINPRPYTDYAVETWAAKFGRKPAWRKYQYVNISELLGQQRFSLETFKAAWDAYLADEDPFVKDRQGHSLSWFSSKFDVYIHKSKTETTNVGVSDEEKAKMAADAERQVREMREKPAESTGDAVNGTFFDNN